jgi:hypothetical protein
MGHQVPTPLDQMVWRGCQFVITEETANKWISPGVYGDHAEYTNGCLGCWIASGGGDD